MRQRRLGYRPAVLCLALAAGTSALGLLPPRPPAVEAHGAQPEETFQLGDGRFRITGKAPAAFTEFSFLYLEGPVLIRDRDRRRLVPKTAIPVRGELYGRRKFRIQKASLKGDQLTFETLPVRATRFHFRGKAVNVTAGEDQPITPAFRGRLTKLVNGKTTAKADVTFGWLEPEF